MEPNAPGVAVFPEKNVTSQAERMANCVRGSRRRPEDGHPGEAFYEAPSDIHLPNLNVSKTQPAKLLVFFVKDKRAPPTVVLDQKNASH
jgi:hypothetical protein